MTTGNPNKDDNNIKLYLRSPSGGRTITSNLASQSISLPSNYIYSLERPFLKHENSTTIPNHYKYNKIAHYNRSCVKFPDFTYSSF